LVKSIFLGWYCSSWG